MGALAAYAASVTLIAVLVILLIGRLAGRLKKEVAEDESSAAAAPLAG